MTRRWHLFNQWRMLSSCSLTTTAKNLSARFSRAKDEKWDTNWPRSSPKWPYPPQRRLGVNVVTTTTTGNWDGQKQRPQSSWWFILYRLREQLITTSLKNITSISAPVHTSANSHFNAYVDQQPPSGKYPENIQIFIGAEEIRGQGKGETGHECTSTSYSNGEDVLQKRSFERQIHRQCGETTECKIESLCARIYLVVKFLLIQMHTSCFEQRLPKNHGKILDDVVEGLIDAIVNMRHVRKKYAFHKLFIIILTNRTKAQLNRSINATMSFGPRRIPRRVRGEGSEVSRGLQLSGVNNFYAFWGVGREPAGKRETIYLNNTNNATKLTTTKAKEGVGRHVKHPPQKKRGKGGTRGGKERMTRKSCPSKCRRGRQEISLTLIIITITENAAI